MYSLVVGGLRLAPISNITVEEPNDFETISTGNARECDNCPGLERSWKFILYLQDCDLVWATAFRDQLDLAACAPGALLVRTVRQPLKYLITGASTRLVQTTLQYQGILAIELILNLKDYAQVEPLAMRVAILAPTITMTNSVTQTAKAIAITVPVPTVVLV